MYPVEPVRKIATVVGCSRRGRRRPSRGVSVRIGGVRIARRCERHRTPRWRLRSASFDERIAPLPQRRNVDIDPIIPPIEFAHIVAEFGALFGWKRRREPLDIFGFENVIVVQDKWLEERNELSNFIELA